MCKPWISASKPSLYIILPVSCSYPVTTSSTGAVTRLVLSDEGSEVLGLSELAVHGSKADIGDRIQR